MNILNNLKQLIGIGGMKCVLSLDSTTISSSPQSFSGSVLLTSDIPVNLKKMVCSVEMNVTEKDSSGQKKETASILGKFEQDLSGTKLDKAKELTQKFKTSKDFYQMKMTNQQTAAASGGAAGFFGNLNAKLSNQKVQYFFKVEIFSQELSFPAVQKVELKLV